jgi:type II secretory pathway predicted ATPase ExeA
MLVRHVLDGLEEELFEACLLVPVPAVSDGAWVLDRLARQLGIEAPARDRAAVLAEVYERLAIVREDGRHSVVILDEAQVLVEQGVLAELRGLLNLEYEERRLLTLVLVGLPSLARAVAEEPALAERIDVPLHVGALTNEESPRYLTHRIRAAGGNPAILESGAVAALVKWAGGNPRRLNGLADAALFEAHLAGRLSATAADVERAAAELELPAPAPSGGAVAAAPAHRGPASEPRASAAAALARQPAPTRGRAPAQTPAPAQRLAPARDLPEILEEMEAAIELEEVVATGTDPLHAGAGATVALFGDASQLDAAFHAAGEPGATLALFAEPDDLGSESPDLRHGEDSGAELDDLFADLVKD